MMHSFSPLGTRRGQRTGSVITFSILPLVILLLCTMQSEAQQRFKLQRTQRASTPFELQLYAGYNGMSDPADKLQDQFENSGHTSWSGVMLGLQAFIPVDTIVRPIWIGVDAYFQRLVKRDMATKGVTYKSDGTPVHLDETLNAWGANLMFMIDLVPRVSLQLGGGVQYMLSKHDSPSPVTGDFQPLMIPTATGALNIAILSYEHGSIDFNLRAMKGFDEMGSLQIDSLLGFTFNF